MPLTACAISDGHVAAVVAKAVAAVLVLGSPSGAVDPLKPAFEVTDTRINEPSGIAVGIKSPDVLYVHNDSGDSARFFAIDRRSGQTRAEIDVPHADNRDWEDIAVEPDLRGVPSVWLGDIGDNDEMRASISVYRVDEPAVSPALGQTLTETGTQRWRLRYPDGPHDAEALAVDTAHRSMYIVTKSTSQPAQVYRAALTPPGDDVQILTRVGAIEIKLPKVFGLPSVAYSEITAADYSPQQKLFIVRTYLDVWSWKVPTDIPSALKTPPTKLFNAIQKQGEGVAIDGRSVWLNSEGGDPDVFHVGIPPQALRPVAPTQTGAAASQEPEVRIRGAKATERKLALAGLAVLLVVGLGVALRIGWTRHTDQV